MIVYRCENLVTERGPYHALDIFGGLLTNHNNMDKYPTPYEDMRESNDKKLACGFTSLSQLKYWFTRYQRDELRKKGWLFFMFEIDASEVIIGKRQCLFKREIATKIKELDEDAISQISTYETGMET